MSDLPLTYASDWRDHPHHVYEMYASDGTCLYVGCSINIGQRLNQHRSRQEWWPDVERITITTLPNLVAGEARERERIRELNPTHNSVYTDHHSDPGGWTARRARAAARHARGEMCHPLNGCQHCKKLRREPAA